MDQVFSLKVPDWNEEYRIRYHNLKNCRNNGVRYIPIISYLATNSCKQDPVYPMYISPISIHIYSIPRLFSLPMPFG